MRFPLSLLLPLLAACSIETAPSGRPPGPPTPADSLARVEEDSAAQVQVTAALRLYYQRFSARDWQSFRESFWPGATIATRWTPPGRSTPELYHQSVEQFVREAPSGPGRLAVFSEAPVHSHVRSYGDLAQAWVVYRARFGATADSVRVHHGVDAFSLLRHGGQWRIVSLAFTQELPGRALTAPTDTAGARRRPRR
jgi:hypothetical protein